MSDDARTVAWQIGRPPRGSWRVAARCPYGYPVVIATAPGGDPPFPTLYYLTCPHLAEAVSKAESEGGAVRWRDAVRHDRALAERLDAADAAYRAARAAEGGGNDPFTLVGIAGQRDVRGVKCLHAHVAAFLAGIDDPVGQGVLADLARECDDRRCKEAG
jgi:hypothetical protein